MRGRYAIGLLLGLQLIGLTFTALEYRHLRDGQEELTALRNTLESDSSRTRHPESTQTEPPRSKVARQPAVSVKECPPVPEVSPGPPEPSSLSTVWVLPHPPENRGRFLTFASFRQGNVSGRSGAVLFREWTGKDFMETEVPVREVQWDVGRK